MSESDSNASDRRLTKATVALSISVQQLGKAIVDLKAGHLAKTEVSIWNAAAQAEYALFLVALNLGYGSIFNGFSKKHHPRMSEDLESHLQKVLETMTKIMEQIKVAPLVDVYEDLWRVTSILVYIQEKTIRHKR